LTLTKSFLTQRTNNFLGSYEGGAIWSVFRWSISSVFLGTVWTVFQGSPSSVFKGSVFPFFPKSQWQYIWNILYNRTGPQKTQRYIQDLYL